MGKLYHTSEKQYQKEMFDTKIPCRTILYLKERLQTGYLCADSRADKKARFHTQS